MVTSTDAQRSLADEWRAKNPQTPEEIAAFYRDAAGIEADLREWHETRGRRGITAAIVAAAVSIDAKRVLDVGAGMGQDLEALDYGRGRHAVEPNDVLRQRLIRKHVDAVASIEEVTGTFDMVTCIDVLEHVPDPEALLRSMVALLEPGGLLIERTSTHDTSTPLHLEALRGWTPAPTLTRLGFTPRWQVDHMVVWQRIPGIKQVEPASVLLCAYRAISVETSQCLTELGWPVTIQSNDALISRVRSRVVSNWMQETMKKTCS